MNISLIMLVLHFMKKEIVIKRVILASLWEAFAATVIVFVRIPFGLVYIVLVLLVSMLGIRISLMTNLLGEIFLGTVYYYTMSFALSKLFWIGYEIFNVNGIAAVIVAIAIITVTSVIFLVIKYTLDKENIYKVSIAYQGHTCDVRALYDTGNLLSDPVSGKPVSVVEKSGTQDIYGSMLPQKYKVIPFHTIGQEHGVLEGMEVDEITICKGKQKVTYNDAVIAFYDGKLSKDGSFQMILNLRLLLGER